jgi:hypothetical protein
MKLEESIPIRFRTYRSMFMSPDDYRILDWLPRTGINDSAVGRWNNPNDLAPGGASQNR